MSKLLLLLFVPTTLIAQLNVNYSVSNYLRYGTGDERVNSVSQHRDYFENLTEAKITIADFLIGFRLLHDAPPEYGVEFSGLKKRYLEFRKDDMYIRAGNSYTLYGRGLALNLFENRALAFDTGLDGIKMEYKHDVVKLGITAGDVHYVDILDLTRVEDYRVRAGMIEVNPIPELGVGFALASGKSKFPPPAFPDMYAQFDIPEYFVKGSIAGFDLVASYAEKRTTVYNDTNGTHHGTAFYGSLSYAGESFGVTVEYKDYRFGITGPDMRTNPNRAHKALAFQNAPIVHKEHTFTLLSRYPHVIDFNDEVGFQVDVFYTVFKQLTGSINFSASSRHYSFDSVGVKNLFGATVITYGSQNRTTSFLPNFSSKFSPFWEFYTDFQYYFEEGGTDYVLIGLDRRFEDTAEEIHTPTKPQGFVESKRTLGVPFSLQYSISEEWTLKFVMERQWVHDDTNPAQVKYFNHLLSLSAAMTPTVSVTLRYEFTNDHGTVDGRRNWTALDASYRFTKSHTVTLTVGGDRGGQVCANGVCRIVNPFLGVRASVLSYL